MKRKWICFTLALSLVLALAACGGAPEETEPAPSPTAAADTPAPETDAPSTEEPEPSDAPAPAAEGFDPAVAGAWRLVSDVHNGDQEMGLNDEIYMLPDGTFYGSYGGVIPAYNDLLLAGVEVPKATTGNGTLELLEPLLEAYSAMTEEELVNNITEFQIAYEVADITEGSQSELAPCYERYDNDQLTLHITGSYQENPTTVRTVDSTLVYEKIYPFFCGVSERTYFYPYLVGNWTDNMGNQWSFGYDADTQNLSAEFHFEMVDAKGAQHVGTYAYVWLPADGDLSKPEQVDFRFEDFETGKYDLVSFDSTTLSLRDATGKDFTLTRA